MAGVKPQTLSFRESPLKPSEKKMKIFFDIRPCLLPGIVGCDKSRETRPISPAAASHSLPATPPSLKPVTFVAGAGYLIESKRLIAVESV